MESWINQEGWDADAEARAWSPKTERVIDLRLDWGEVKRKLSPESGPQQHQPLLENDVSEEYDLDKLDPTQRAFANRVLRWARELVQVYKQNKSSGTWKQPPRLRTCAHA